MDKRDIDILLDMGERLDFECKKAASVLPKSIWQTYSSFANTTGGTIVLGIAEGESGDEVFEIIGVAQPQKLKKELFDTLNSDKVSQNILTDSDVEIVDYDGKQLLCIHVPQADYRQRPVYINGNPLKGSYKRNHEGDYHCTEEEVKAMIRDTNESGNDGLLMVNYDMNDVDPSTLKAYRNRFASLNPDHLWNEYDDKEFLRNMGGYTRDRNLGREGLTLAGLLMFGKGLSIRERLDNLRMDYLDLTNLQDESRWSDRLTYDGRWENNLYNFFTRVQSKLISDIKRPFELDGVERKDDSLLHKVVREALTNLIIHADYLILGVLKVEKHSDKLVFSNPGSLKIPLTDIYKGGHSQARNPAMQVMLRMIGFGENIGSGFPTMLDACRKENWRRPLLTERTDLHLVELTISMVSLISPDCESELLKRFGSAYAELEKAECLILATALTEGSVDNATIQHLLGKHSLEVGRLLYGLVQRGFLLSSGKRRWTTYAVNTPDHRTAFKQKSQGVNSSSKSQGVNSSSKSQGAASKLQNSGSKTQGAKPRKKRKERMEENLLRFCRQPRTLQEIAEYFNYSDRYRMKRIYIDPLLGKELRMTEDGSKTNPAQRYVLMNADTFPYE